MSLLSARLWIEQRIAWRFMAENPLQTLLISIAIAVGTAVIIFITALMNGLQQNTVNKTLGSQAHIKLESTRLYNRMPAVSLDQHRILLETQRAQPLQRIDSWQAVMQALDAIPSLTAVSPIVSGPALVQRGRASASVIINGIDAQRYQKIVDLPSNIQLGSYRISSQDVLIGSELAKDLGLQAGDKLRIQAADGRTALVRVSGVFSMGVQELDSRQIYIDLKQAQTLLNLVGGITGLEVKIDDIFTAREWGARLERLTGLHVKNWMDNNSQLLNALRSQKMTTQMIRLFVGLAVALGIASVMAVSVVQRTREVGILRAMGSTRDQILRVFLIQGAMLGAIGAVFGMAGGYVLVHLFNGFGARLFFVSVHPEVTITALFIAICTGILAAALPARRASRYDPAEAIRYV
ncbi:ABC transporter permease [Thiopseudomonas acetoxidans]|uniref:FtsX-like permease family protein n=1 Tax=Thiopseudomonas acetoxidans TaxID=3041622 RepID=A0ABT7SRP4_9GAMM|nr:FtsX-like permease family protein [Thiopseudomonas sp. CY1220]MDM7858866.1 FtsX-like permease family protein [Thiopseudomonas sp. CY1220]